MNITFSNFKSASAGTISGITLWSSAYTKEYIDSVVSGYTLTTDFATINGSAITEGGNLVIEGGSGATYSAGTNIDITNNVISVTGITVPTKTSDLENDSGFATSGNVETQIENALSSYTPTSGFTTINGSAITSGGNITVEGTPYSGGTGIGVSNHIISVTGDYETVVELTQVEYDALTAYSENTTYIITDAPAINMSAYSTTVQVQGMITSATSGLASTTYVDNSVSGKADTTAVTQSISDAVSGKQDTLVNQVNIKSINGTSLLGSGNIQISEGGTYTGGDNIEITAQNVINVTGITSYTGITSGDVVTALGFTPISGVDLSDYYTSAQTNTAISNAVSGKVDTSAYTAYTASTQTELGNKQDASAMTAYYTSAETNTAISNATSGKVDTSALTAYYTSAQTDTAISNATSGLASTEYVDNSVSGKADSSAVTADIAAATAATTGWVSQQGYLTTESDPIFTGSPAYGITSEDITNWNSVSGKVDTTALTQYYTSAQTENAISGAISDLKTEIEGEIPTKVSDLQNDLNFVDSGDVQTQIDNSISGKVDTSALTANYYTKSEIDSGMSYVEGLIADKADSSAVTEEIATALEDYTPTSSLTIPTATSELTNDSGFITMEDIPEIPSATSELTNDSGFITDADIPTSNTAFTNDAGYLTEHQSLSAYSTTQEMNTAISNSVSGKVDTSVFTAYTASTQTELGNKQDASAMTAYYTSAQTDTAISNATSGLASQTWVENKGYLTAFTESDPVFMASPASGITSNDITNWNAVTGLTIPTSNTAFTNDAGYVTSGNVETQITNRNLIGNNSATTQTIANVRVLTQTQYNNLATKENNVLYIINGS